MSNSIRRDTAELPEGDAIVAFRVGENRSDAQPGAARDIEQWMDLMRHRVRPGDVVVQWDAWIVAALENVARVEASRIVQRLQEVLPSGALQETRATLTPTRLSAEAIERIRPNTMPVLG